MGIVNNDYLAYIFDEVAVYLEDKATDKEGVLNWDKIKWSDVKRSNEELMKLANTGR